MGLGNLNSIRKLWNHISNAIRNPLLFKNKEWWEDFFIKLWKVEEFRIIWRRDIMGFLKGKKTYLIAMAIGALTALKALGFIDEATYQTILGLLGAGGLMTLRAGVTTETKR